MTERDKAMEYQPTTGYEAARKPRHVTRMGSVMHDMGQGFYEICKCDPNPAPPITEFTPENMPVVTATSGAPPNASSPSWTTPAPAEEHNLRVYKVEGHWYVDIDVDKDHSGLANGSTLSEAMDSANKMLRHMRNNAIEELSDGASVCSTENQLRGDASGRTEVSPAPTEYKEGDEVWVRAKVDEPVSQTERIYVVIGNYVAAVNPKDIRREALAAAPPAPHPAEMALEHDRSQVAEHVTAMKNTLQNYAWLLDGRGSYEWDDDRYRLEFQTVCTAMQKHVEVLARIAADWTNCPKDLKDVQVARDRHASAERVRELAEELRSISTALWSTNAHRGRQIRDVARRLLATLGDK